MWKVLFVVLCCTCTIIDPFFGDGRDDDADTFAVTLLPSRLERRSKVPSCKTLESKELQRIDNFTVANTATGMTDAAVIMMLHDEEGVLWGATYDGVFRYDGKSWTNYSTAEGLFCATTGRLFIDVIGEIWAVCFHQEGLDDGLARFDGQRWDRSSFFADSPIGSIQNVTQTMNGDVWVAGSRALARFDGQQWFLLNNDKGLPGTYFYNLLGMGDGTLWITGEKDYETPMLIRYSDGIYHAFDNDAAAPHGFVSLMIEATDGALWVVSSGDESYRDLVYRYDGNAWSLYLNENDGLPSGRIEKLIAIETGQVFAVVNLVNTKYDELTDKRVLSRYDGSTWRRVNIASDFPNNAIRDAYRSADGAVWILSVSGTNIAVAKYDGGKVRTYSLFHDMPAGTFLRLVENDQGDIAAVNWATDHIGLTFFDGESFETFETAHETSGEEVYSVHLGPDRSLWLSVAADGNGPARLFRYYGGKLYRINGKPGLIGNEFNSVFETTDGSAWLNVQYSRSGLSRFDGERWSSHFIEYASEVGHLGVRKMLEASDGAIWVTTDIGVFRYDGEQWRKYNNEDGLLGDSCNEIVEIGDGRVCVAIGDSDEATGVSCFDGIRWKSYTDGNGLGNGSVTAMFASSDGRLWVATNDWDKRKVTVARYNGRHWKRYKEWGHPIVRMMEDWTGHVWMSTDYGSARYNNGTWDWFGQFSIWGGGGELPLLMANSGEVWLPTWIGSDEYLSSDQGPSIGVARFDGQNLTEYGAESQIVLYSDAAFYEACDGSIFAVSASKYAVHRFDGANWSDYLGSGDKPTKPRLLFVASDGSVYTSGTIEEGDIVPNLHRYDGHTWTEIGVEDGLLNGSIFSFHEAKDGSIWLSTNEGISRLVFEDK